MRDVTGVILVGGKSRRMGRDKAFLEIEGRPMVDRVIDLFRSSFERVLLVGDRAERFQTHGLEVVPDIYPGSALGGLYTGLSAAQTGFVFVASCDLAYPDSKLLHYLCGLKEGYDAVVPLTRAGYEPLYAVYGKSCLSPMREQLESGDYCAYAYYPALNIRFVEAPEIEAVASGERAFRNINTPEDLRAVGGSIPGEVPRPHTKNAAPARSGMMGSKVVSFVAKSGTGKTTLLEKVIVELKSRGYKVGVVKHDAHRFDIDHPGKDSYRLTEAGADVMLISSPEKLAMVRRHAEAPDVETLLATYFADMDIVLTEGFKKSQLPKIELHRKERSPTLICRGEENDPCLIAVASDEKLELDVPLLDLNDPSAVADFIVERFMKG